MLARLADGFQELLTVIGASLSEPHTDEYYVILGSVEEMERF